MGFNPKEFKPSAEPVPTVSVMYTRVGVSMGDHAQDVVRMIEVDLDDTVQSIIDRTLLHDKRSWDRNRYDDFLVIRMVEPKPAPPVPKPVRRHLPDPFEDDLLDF